MDIQADSRQILVIEDNLPINKLFCKNLSASGFDCYGVTTIDEAIRHINETPPDLLILDFELPDGYGTRVLDYLQTKNVHIPTIVVSASTRVLEIRHHIEYTIDHILVKPVSPRHLSQLATQTLAM
jgi:DNA-binding response OmpR family regulator